jgi:hypothetical protein
MTRHWRMMITGYAVADGVYWIAVKPRLRRSLGVRTPPFTGN